MLPRLPLRISDPPTSKRVMKGISSSAAAHSPKPAAVHSLPSSAPAPFRRQAAHALSERPTSTNRYYHHQSHLEQQSKSLLPSQQQQQQQAQQQPMLSLHTPAPLLLLTGDEFHVSNEGVARSYYQLHINQHGDDVEKGTSSNNSATPPASSSWTIEEAYRLEESSKTFVLRERNLFGSTTSTTTLELQEMDTRQVGTGGTTWEASIAMALYFARHPDQFQGRVVELGSGVGLGGILLHHVTHRQNPMVLTDGSDQVLEQCRANIERRNPAMTGANNNNNNNKLDVLKLDWNDTLLEPSTKNDSQRQRYNTVLACDCAYRPQDIPALSATLKSMLSRTEDSNNNKIHLFGPYNRAAYHCLIEALEKDESLEVHSEWVEMKRYRLAASDSRNNAYASSKGPGVDATSVISHPYNAHQGVHHHHQTIQQLEDELEEASQSTTKFLHVSATFRKQPLTDKEGNTNFSCVSLADID